MSPARKQEGDRDDDFLKAAEEAQPGILRELWDFLCHSKKWWILPILVALLLVSALVLIGGTSLSAFLYPLF